MKENANKICERTVRSPLVVPPVSTTVNDVRSRQHFCRYATSREQRISRFADILVLRERNALCHPVLELCDKDLQLLDVYREMSAAYGPECMCRAQVYTWVATFKTGVTSIHDADRPGQAHKGLGATVTKKSRRQVFFFLTEIQEQVHRLQRKGAILKNSKCYIPCTKTKFCVIRSFQLSCDS